MLARGHDPASANGLPQNDLRERRQAAAMAEALWPATWGYFLRHCLAPLLHRAGVAGLRAHFLRFVSPRGPLPALRLGGVPYGVWPVSSLTGWGAEGAAGAWQAHPPALR